MKRKENKGFTLVELIVVLVILAILAAILVPALLGYIDKARERKDINTAKAYLDAAQSMMVELYGKGGGAANGCVIPENKPYVEVKDDAKGDVDARRSKFAQDVFNLVGEENPPYLFMFAMGNAKSNPTYRASRHDQYTVFYALYMRDKESVPLYYYAGEWTKQNPSVDSLGNNKIVDNNKTNKYTYNGKTVYLQYYVLSYGPFKNDGTPKETVNSMWVWIKSDEVTGR